MKYIYLNEAEQSALQQWHGNLNDNRGDRARLRRAECAEDILLTAAFHQFLRRMPAAWQAPQTLFSRAAVAGLLAHVQTDAAKGSFATQLARPVKGDRPPMSELRFQQLQKSRTSHDFYRRIIRAIHLLGGGVNVCSLANDIIHWHDEFEHQVSRQPARRLAVRWATDYFTALPKSSH